MTIIDIKGKDRKTIGSIEEVHVQYEIKDKSHRVVGYIEITQRGTELKDKSKRTIGKFDKRKGLENSDLLQTISEKILTGN